MSVIMSKVRIFSAFLLCFTFPIGALDFERLNSWSDDGFDLSAEVFFSDESTLWAFRNEYAVRMRRGGEDPIKLWALEGINLYGEPETGPVVPDGYRYQTRLQYFDESGKQLIVNILDNGDGAIVFRLLDLKTLKWTKALIRGWSTFYDKYVVDQVFAEYGVVVPQGESSIAVEVSAFDKTTGMADIELRRFANLDQSYDQRYRVERTLRVDTSEMGALTGELWHTPLKRILWTDGNDFFLISDSECFVGYLHINDEKKTQQLKVIPGAFWLKPSHYIEDSRGVKVSSFITTYADPSSFGCVKTWGSSFLLLDASPVKQLVTDLPSFGRLFKLVDTGDSYEDDFSNKRMLDTILRNTIISDGWSKEYSGGWSGNGFLPLDPTKSMPYRIAAYDPRTNTVADTGLPYFHTVGKHPLTISPKGNLIAFAEKDPQTGMFVSYSMYRIILDAEVSDEKVRFRSTPSLKGVVLGAFSKGERVKVIDRSEEKEKIENFEDYWYQVRRSDGREVWMYGAYLKMID